MEVFYSLIVHCCEIVFTCFKVGTQSEKETSHSQPISILEVTTSSYSRKNNFLFSGIRICISWKIISRIAWVLCIFFMHFTSKNIT